MRITPALVFSFLIAVPATNGSDQVINVHLNDKVPAGKMPSLVVSVHADLQTLRLELTRDDGKKINQHQINIGKNSERTFHIKQGPGVHRYRGTLTVIFPGGNQGAMNLDFSAEVVASLGLAVNRKNLDLENNSLVLTAKQVLFKVQFNITADDGTLLAKGIHTVDPPARKTSIKWITKKPGKVLKINLTAYTQDKIHEELELVPWHYAIPHEEVQFETGKWDVLATESEKLNKSFDLLMKGVKKYGNLLEVKLYIAGYTDTVAPADSNQVLSEKRAQAIASYFQSKGFSQPIYYQGFGERGLKIPTPDETDEPQNRRAEYVLAAEPPPIAVPGSASRWKKLQ